MRSVSLQKNILGLVVGTYEKDLEVDFNVDLYTRALG